MTVKQADDKAKEFTCTMALCVCVRACMYVCVPHMQVREAVSMLDLDVVMYPCPRDGDVWRPKVVSEGGKAQFPYLKDPNTGGGR